MFGNSIIFKYYNILYTLLYCINLYKYNLRLYTYFTLL